MVLRRTAAWIGSSASLFRYRSQAPCSAWRHRHADRRARVRAILRRGADDLLVGTGTNLLEYRDGTLARPAWAAALDGAFIPISGPAATCSAGTDKGACSLLRDQHLLQFDQAPAPQQQRLDSAGIERPEVYVSGIDGVWRTPVDSLPDRSPHPQRPLGRPVLPPNRGANCSTMAGALAQRFDGDSIWYPPSRVRCGWTRASSCPPLAARRSSKIPAPCRDVVRRRAAHCHPRAAAGRRDPASPACCSATDRAAVPATAWSATTAEMVDVGARRTAYQSAAGDYRFELEARLGRPPHQVRRRGRWRSSAPLWHERSRHAPRWGCWPWPVRCRPVAVATPAPAPPAGARKPPWLRARPSWCRPTRREHEANRNLGT